MTEALASSQITAGSPFRFLGRGVRENERAKVRDLAVIWAHRLCGHFNKDIKLFMVGPQGSGKSRSALYLGMRVAQEEARMLLGTPDKWEKYFPRDLSQVFIGDPSAHADALKNIKKHGIYILDDAGVSINARNFMTSYNKSLNDIFQTVRTDNALIVINAPDTFLIDNVPRNIVSHFGEVSESQHSRGINFIKIFKMERKFRSGETHYHHYQFGNDQVVRWRFRDVPADMVEIYEKRRDEATQRIKSNAGKDREDKKKDNSKREQAAQAREDVFTLAEQYVDKDGLSIRAAITQANKESGTKFSRTVFDNWRVTKGFS